MPACLEKRKKSMAAGRSDSCSVALVVLVVLFQLLLFKCYQPIGNNHNPARKLTENFHASTWRLFKPASCIAKDVKFRKQTTRKFNNFNGYFFFVWFNFRHCWECLGEAYMSRGSYNAAMKAFSKAAEVSTSLLYFLNMLCFLPPFLLL